MEITILKEWPHRYLRSFSNTSATQELADEILQRFGFDPDSWCAAGRLFVQWEKLRAEKEDIYAMIIPQNNDSFVILIDPYFNAEQQLFLFGHEIGHSFFYIRTPTKIAWHYRPTKEQHAHEERFCDLFASTLTGIQPIN